MLEYPSMADQMITCPNCSHQIPVSEALTGQITQQLQTQLRAEFTKKFDQKVQAEKTKVLAEAMQQAEQKLAVELKDLQSQNAEQAKKIAQAQQDELEFRKQKRELEAKQKELAVEVERTLDQERGKIAEQAKKEAAEESDRKVRERDKQIDMMRLQIEDMRRKAEQGSMQIQGEAQEDDLKASLQQAFPADKVEDVGQGVRGADIVQTVHSQYGVQLGVMLWESKNTKAWSNDWVKKLKSDQGLAKADVCILVTQVLPDTITTFGLIDGVWVCEYKYALALAQVLRAHITELSKVKTSLVGKDEKMEILYSYLSGPQFRNRIENIVMAFSSLQTGLEKEKRSMQRIWAKREQEISKVMFNTTGMYGDLQGIIGEKILPTVEALELPEGDEEND